MSIEKNFEIAKQYISENKLVKALEILNSLLKVKTDKDLRQIVFFEISKIYSSLKEYKKSVKILKSLLRFKSDNKMKQNIYFELGKIYMDLGENEKSLKYLSKINKSAPVYDFAKELLLKNYKVLNRPEKQIYILKKNQFLLQKEENIKNLSDSIIENKLFQTGFKFVNDYKNKIADFDKMLKRLDEGLVSYIQYLSENHKYNEIKKIFKNINKYIPNSEKKIKNILLNEYELAQNKKCLKSYPRILNVVLTTKCNLDCIMCDKREHDNKYDLSDEEVENLIEVMPYLEKLILRGGEVFLHKRIIYILEQAKKYNVNVEIVTNGLLLTEKIINLLLDVVGEITFSIDSINKNVYEKIRVGSSYEKLLKNIDLFNKFNKKRNYKINTRLAMVVMKSNYKEIESVIKFASEHNFKEMYLLPIRGDRAERAEFIFSGGFDKNIVKELNRKRNIFEQIAKKYSVKLFNTLPARNLGNVKSVDFNNSSVKEEKKSNVCDNVDNIESIEPCFDKKENSCLKKQNKKRNENFIKCCHAPWKQMFLFKKIYSPTCICTPFLSKTNNCKKNFIMDNWNNNIMKTYRYKIANDEYAGFCAKDCLFNSSKYVKIL